MKRFRRRALPEVELTPLIDVLFILIIFFVLTTSFVKSQLSIDLPYGGGSPINDSPVVISVNSEGQFSVDGKETDRSRVPVLAEEAYLEGKTLLIAGDREAPYGLIATLLDELREKGIEKISLALGGEKKP